jgi:hypothetical protein
MRVPQVSERIKEAPAQALRGVFAGIGQLLLYTDKLRNKAPYAQVPAASPPAAPRAEPAAPRTGPAEPVPDRAAASAPADRDVVAEPAAAEAPRTSGATKTPAAPKIPATPTATTEIRDFDKTGNVRLITADEARADDAPAAAGEPATPTDSEPEPLVAAAEDPAPASADDAAPADSEPPLPNYDQLTIASLRARLRNLDVTQVRGLVEYEKGHAGRTDVLTMLERRIAKLEAGD